MCSCLVLCICILAQGIELCSLSHVIQFGSTQFNTIQFISTPHQFKPIPFNSVHFNSCQNRPACISGLSCLPSTEVCICILAQGFELCSLSHVIQFQSIQSNSCQFNINSSQFNSIHFPFNLAPH